MTTSRPGKTDAKVGAARGAVDGLAEDDWYMAERELGDFSRRES